MNPFWHVDAGNIGVLLVLLAIYRKINIMSYQHGLLWKDYEKRHKMNGGGLHAEPNA